MASSDITLAPGEKGLFAREFSPSLIMFYLRTNMMVTNRRVVIRRPNTILGLIPVGYEERSMPIGAISGATASMSVKAGQLIICVICALLCLLLIGDADGGAKLFFVVLLILFIVWTISAIVSKLILTNSGGGIAETSVSFAENAKLEEFKNQLNEYLYSAGSAGQSWQDASAQGNNGNPAIQQNSQTQWGSAPQQWGNQGQQQWGNPGQQWGNQGPQQRND
ncbi:hypothetical protein [Corynebacterium sp.]|uniref:hypothetical protein n=1 Tax=Corynebacterium sp. TaxID=1720 RepID=UPI0026DA7946|nr:hypothetical protein [Corynebacterium sp.]MDO4609744.1 hypothetical protein [Corynebacterium sp.]